MKMSSVLGLMSLMTLGCNEFIEPENAAPVVESARYCVSMDEAGQEHAFIAVRISDSERDSVDVTSRIDGQPISVGPLGSGATGLVTDRPSSTIEHRIEWSVEGEGARCDVGTCLYRPAVIPSGISVELTVVDDEDQTTTASFELSGPEACDA